MRIFKMIGALVVVLAFSAVAVATASAAETLWRFLPGSVGETFKGEQPKKGVLETVANAKGERRKITCAKGKVLLTAEELEGKPKSELLKEGSIEGKDANLVLVVIHFEGCLAEGILPINSLGDNSGIILVHLEVHTCLIKKAEFGLLILVLALHLEVPSVSLLISILEKGLFIAKLEPEGGTSKTKFILSATQKEGKQGIEKCEGGEKETLISKTDNEAELASGLETNATLEPDFTIDKEGQTLMEK